MQIALFLWLVLLLWRPKFGMLKVVTIPCYAKAKQCICLCVRRVEGGCQICIWNIVIVLCFSLCPSIQSYLPSLQSPRAPKWFAGFRICWDFELFFLERGWIWWEGGFSWVLNPLERLTNDKAALVPPLTNRALPHPVPSFDAPLEPMFLIFPCT